MLVSSGQIRAILNSSLPINHPGDMLAQGVTFFNCGFVEGHRMGACIGLSVLSKACRFAQVTLLFFLELYEGVIALHTFGNCDLNSLL